VESGYHFFAVATEDKFDQVLHALARNLWFNPQFKILKRVIVANTVLVMNGLAGQKFPPDVFFHDYAVLTQVNAIDLLNHISLVVDLPTPTTQTGR